MGKIGARVVAGSAGGRVVTSCTIRRNSANSPRIRVTLLAAEVGRLGTRLGTRPGSGRSCHNLLGVINREEGLLTCLRGGSVRECHTIIGGLNLHGWF